MLVSLPLTASVTHEAAETEILQTRQLIGAQDHAERRHVVGGEAVAKQLLRITQRRTARLHTLRRKSQDVFIVSLLLYKVHM